MNDLVLKELKKHVNFQNFLNRRLFIHSRYGNTEKVKTYIQEGANVNYKKSTDAGYKRYPLIEASIQGHSEVVKELLESGAWIDVQDEASRTSFIHATIREHDEVVEILKEFGADQSIEDIDQYTAEDHKKANEMY